MTCFVDSNCFLCRSEMKTRNRRITTPWWRYNPFSEHDNHSWTITYSDKPYACCTYLKSLERLAREINECLPYLPQCLNQRENVKHRCWYRWAFKDGIIPYLHVNLKINLILISDCNRKSNVSARIACDLEMKNRIILFLLLTVITR